MYTVAAIQKKHKRLSLVQLAFLIFGLALPLLVSTPVFAAATAQWNNKDGSLAYLGTTYIRHPVVVGPNVAGGQTFVPSSEAKAMGTKGFSPPNCPTRIMTVDTNLSAATEAHYYSGMNKGASIMGCQYDKALVVKLGNKYTYKDPTAGTNIVDKLPKENATGSNLEPCTADASLSPDPAMCNTPCKDANDCSLVTNYLNPIINKFLAPLAALAVVIGLIWGAIGYSMSAGDASKVAEAKDRIQKALIGLVAFIFLYALLNWLIPGGLLP